MWEIVQFLTPPLVACVTILGLLGYLGIHVLKREIIFIDIALAQIAAVGATFAHLYLGREENSVPAYLCAFAFTVLAALFFSQIDKRITRISHEAIIGVTYAIAAAAALFILALAAGGDVHMENMLTGSILWARWPDILAIAVLFFLVGLFHFLYRRKFIRLSESYGSGAVRGKENIWWDFLFYVSMGMVITFSVKIAGVLVIFSFLIIPATFSALFADSWRDRLLWAWGVGIFSIISGLILSYFLDFCCGPAVITMLGLSLIGASLLVKFRRANPGDPGHRR
ncbi:MAG: metal ABC transporter permease [Candidatus Krumholzibacteriota bacterium]|nr:metal ABC transporter permease [Candidatus Krumholzibacteriota bacterium]